jgi:hypothetical protein
MFGHTEDMLVLTLGSNARFAYALQPPIALVREVQPAYGDALDAVDESAAALPPAHEPAADSPAPDPCDDADALEELGDRIATLAAHVHAATHRLLVLIADFDRRRGWELGGHRSCAHWLAFRTGIDLGAAREKVRTARALVDLPETSAAMSRGELSFSQVRALSRVARPDNELPLLELARGCTIAQLERMVRGRKRGSRKDEAALERERLESRTFSIFPDLDGMYVVRGKLPPELGVLLMRAIEAASDHLYRAEPVEAPDTEQSAAQRRADALALLAERAMAAGFGHSDGAGDEAPVSGSRAERYQVVLHVDECTLSADGEDITGRSELDDGTRVSPETSRRLACDAGLVRIRRAHDGSVLDVGRKTRTIPPALRRALEARDRGCRFPGCGRRFTDGHHLRHWADGGETSLSNTVLLCRYHHALVHEGGWRMEWWGEGRPTFFGPRGQTCYEGRWEPPELPGDAVQALIDENVDRGVDPDWRTAGARWKREEDVPTDVLFAAYEALS